MARKDKLLEKLCNTGASFTWDEACQLMRLCGFEIKSATRGSGRKFYHAEKNIMVRLHEPHPGNEMKGYAKRDLADALRSVGELK